MKRIIAVAFLLYSTSLFCQEHSFKPLWKEGTVKKITIMTKEKEIKNGEISEDTSTYNWGKIEVLKDRKDSYLIELLYENQALAAAMELYEKVGEEMKDFQDLKLQFSIDKDSGKAKLENWKEAQKFMNECFDQLTDLMAEKAPEVAPMMTMAFQPIKEIFESQENVEAYMEDDLGYLLVPFGRAYTIGESIKTVETSENPFNPMQEISVTTILQLSEINEAENTAMFTKEIELDLTEFMEMMKELMRKMGESFGANDSTMAEKTKEMDDFEMDMTNQQVINFDTETTWPTTVVATTVVKVTDPRSGEKTKKEVVTTTILR